MFEGLSNYENAFYQIHFHTLNSNWATLNDLFAQERHHQRVVDHDQSPIS